MGNDEINNGIVTKQSIMWNIIGSVVASSSSFILLLCVTRTVGAAEGGIFSLAFATAQILLTVGKFGVRSYQATDIQQELSFGIYLHTRIWFCAAMLLLGIIYVIAAGYDSRKSIIFILVIIIKMVDAVEDVFHGQLQSNGQLDVAGKLLTARNLITMMIFAVSILYFDDLLSACAVTAFVSLIIGLWMNVSVTNKYIAVHLQFEWTSVSYLIRACFPLFAGSFLSLYIYNAPKYAIDIYGTEEQITYYAIIFMPAFVINMFSEFIFKPLLTRIAFLWNENMLKEFLRTILKLIGNIIGITIFVIIGAWLCGAELLSLIYKVDITAYRAELIVLLISGGFSAGVYLLYNVLTAMRMQKIILSSYGSAALVISILAFVMAYFWDIQGAVYAYLLTEVFLLGAMILSTWYGYRKRLREYEDRNYDISSDQ